MTVLSARILKVAAVAAVPIASARCRARVGPRSARVRSSVDRTPVRYSA
jgi:hypothetical protein